MESQNEILVKDLDLPIKIINKLEENKIYTASELKWAVYEYPYIVKCMKGVGNKSISEIKKALDIIELAEGISIIPKASEDEMYAHYRYSDIDRIGLSDKITLALKRNNITSIAKVFESIKNGNIKGLRNIGEKSIRDIIDCLYKNNYIDSVLKDELYDKYDLSKKPKLEYNSYVAYIDFKLGNRTYHGIYIKNNREENVYFEDRIPPVNKKDILKTIKKGLKENE